MNNLDFGIKRKLYDFELFCEDLKSKKISKRDLRKLKKDFSDIQYYLKKEEKRGKITNYNDVISKYEKIYDEIRKTNT
jgi:hypothetical protein